MSFPRHGCRLALVASLATIGWAADATIPGLDPGDTASASASATATSSGDTSSAGAPAPGEVFLPGVDPADQGPDPAPVPRHRGRAGWSWVGSARAAVGIDSNVAILPDEGGGAVNEDSGFIEGEIDGGGQYNRGEHRFRLMGNLLRNHYVENDDYDLERYGAMATWQRLTRPWLPSAVLSHNHYRIDDTSVLGDSALSLALARLHDHRHISIAQITYQHLAYRVSDDLDADRLELRFSHWLLFGSAHRRLSVAVAWRSNQADSEVESYTAIRSQLEGRWRWESGLAGRRTDLLGRLSWQTEDYDQAAAGQPTEDTDILELSARCRWWWHEDLFLGPVLQITDRDSTIKRKVYDRTRFSLEAGYDW
jgi:hypothetical protein